MKSFISIIVSLLAFVSVQAQGYSVAKSGSKGFNIENTTTIGTVELYGNTYEVRQAPSGKKCLAIPSTKGGLYPLWVAKDIQDSTISGIKVDLWAKNDGTPVILKKSQRGHPTPIWLGTLTGDKIEYMGKKYDVMISGSGKPFALVNKEGRLKRIRLEKN